jgi:hypothetical protein
MSTDERCLNLRSSLKTPKLINLAQMEQSVSSHVSPTNIVSRDVDDCSALLYLHRKLLWLHKPIVDCFPAVCWHAQYEVKILRQFWYQLGHLKNADMAPSARPRTKSKLLDCQCPNIRDFQPYILAYSLLPLACIAQSPDLSPLPIVLGENHARHDQRLVCRNVQPSC